MKAVRPVISSNDVPYLQGRLVGLHSTSERDKEGKKERTIMLRMVSNGMFKDATTDRHDFFFSQDLPLWPTA